MATHLRRHHANIKTLNEYKKPQNIKPMSCMVFGEKLVHTEEIRESLIQAEYDRRVNSGKFPFKCEPCRKAYTANTNLSDHIRIKHNERYSCLVCELLFGKEGNMIRHYKTFHGIVPSDRSNDLSDGRTVLQASKDKCDRIYSEADKAGCTNALRMYLLC